LGQTEKDRHRRSRAGQPPTTEVATDRLTQPFRATFGHSGGLSWISTERVRRGERQFNHRQRKVKAEARSVYCGEVVEINYPLLPIGIKTPSSMCLHSSLRYIDPPLPLVVVTAYSQGRCRARNRTESIKGRSRIGLASKTRNCPKGKLLTKW